MSKASPRLERADRPLRADVTHYQVDWRYVACRSLEQRGCLPASRNPAEVTCPRCKRARPTEFPEYNPEMHLLGGYTLVRHTGGFVLLQFGLAVRPWTLYPSLRKAMAAFENRRRGL